MWSPDLLKYSSPAGVLAAARKHGYDPTKITESRTKSKKYAIITPDGRRVNFGQRGYEDYTKHHDEDRRQRFRQRNSRWAEAPRYSAAKLAYTLLW